jgi:hypothetical protein
MLHSALEGGKSPGSVQTVQRTRLIELCTWQRRSSPHVACPKSIEKLTFTGAAGNFTGAGNSLANMITGGSGLSAAMNRVEERIISFAVEIPGNPLQVADMSRRRNDLGRECACPKSAVAAAPRRAAKRVMHAADDAAFNGGRAAPLPRPLRPRRSAR